MLLKLKSSILLIIVACVFFSCEKEYSLEGNAVGGSAAFTFTGAPSACTNAIVTGIYQAGVALDATNQVSIAVNVTTAGTYVISTATADGFSFSGTGTFTSTGAQNITLTGSGTPTAAVAGTFSFTPGTDGCAFSVTVTSAAAGGTAAFTYAGSPGSCTTPTLAGTYTAGAALTAQNTVAVSVNVTATGSYTISTPVADGISFTGSGSFTATGVQTITLTGTGTPTSAGVIDFTPSNNGCSFSITVNPPASGDFLNCTIDGTARTFNVALSGTSTDATTFSISGNETSDVNTPFFAISLKKSPAITTGAYDAPSVTNFSTICIPGYSDGVSSTGWSSNLAGQANGFTVTVTSFTANKIAGTFSGSLYDNDGQGSNPKTITLGQFSVSY